ncbi:hypothetical protein ACQPXT_18240 [Streptomyces sp. CA-100214]
MVRLRLVEAGHLLRGRGRAVGTGGAAEEVVELGGRLPALVTAGRGAVGAPAGPPGTGAMYCVAWASGWAAGAGWCPAAGCAGYCGARPRNCVDSACACVGLSGGSAPGPAGGMCGMYCVAPSSADAATGGMNWVAPSSAGGSGGNAWPWWGCGRGSGCWWGCGCAYGGCAP